MPEDLHAGEEGSDTPEDGAKKPEPKGYTIQIDRIQYTVFEEKLTGVSAARSPVAARSRRPRPLPDRAGPPDRKIKDDDTVEIHDGLRFFTAPNTINSWHQPRLLENARAPHMSLPPPDIAYLADKGIAHQVAADRA